MDWNKLRGWAVDFLKSYWTRRGLLSLAILGVSILGSSAGFGLLPAAAVAGIGGIVLTTYDRLKDQWAYEDVMVNLYRGEIAAELGVSPDTVSRTHLKEAAKTNDVLGQALKRQEHKTAVAIVTESFAAVVTVGAVWMFSAVDFLRSMVGGVASQVVGESVPLINFSLSSVLSFIIGVSTVSSISSMIFNDGLVSLIGRTTSLGKAVAHDQILAMQAGIEQGKAVTPEQVYGVLVAGDPKLGRTIAAQFHQTYDKMNPLQQRAVLAQVGVTECMAGLAGEINNRTMEPGKLAYMMGEEHFYQRKVHEVEEKAHAPVCKSFVERLGRAAHSAQTHLSHCERVDASRAEAGALKSVG